MFQARKNTDGALYAASLAINKTRQSPYFDAASGTATLVAGTVTVTLPAGTALYADSTIALTRKTQGGTLTSTVMYEAPSASRNVGAGTIVIQASTSAGAVANTDTSVIDWSITTPCYHYDTTAYTTGSFDQPVVVALTVTAANATDLPSSITLANNVRQVLVVHMGDAVAHANADTTNAAALGNALLTTDVLATAITAANAHKAALNAHFAQATVHAINDTVNTVATANATDLPSLQTLLNALKTAVNAHVVRAVPGHGLQIVAD